MPVANPLKLTRVAKVPTRMVDDMPRRNDLLFNKEVITEVSRLGNPMSLLNFFANLGGTMYGSEQTGKVFDVAHKGVGSEFIRMRKYREQMIPAKVVDASRVPSTMVAGQNFECTIDKFIGEGGEKALLKDQITQIMVVSYRSSSDGRNFDYTFQYIQQPGKTISGSILALDSPINYGFGNSVGEGSLTGNTLVDDGDRYTDTFNVMQIARYVVPQTGSAAADDTFKIAVVEDVNGNSVEMDYVTDLPLRGAKKVFANIDHDILFSTPNFSVTTKQIANRANTTRYPERPTYAGLFFQWDLAPYQWQGYMSAPQSESLQLLRDILTFAYDKNGTSKKYLAYCWGAGRQWLKDVFFYASTVLNYKIELVVDPAGKLGGGRIGYDIDEYMTPDGSIAIIDLGMMLQNWGEFSMANYGSVGYGPRSRRIYLQPVGVSSNGEKSKPCTIYHKEANGFSRAFVLGTTWGMTGKNGLTGTQMAALQEDGLRRMISNEKMRIDSTADVNEMHVLSQICPFMDTDQMHIIYLNN